LCLPLTLVDTVRLVSLLSPACLSFCHVSVCNCACSVGDYPTPLPPPHLRCYSAWLPSADHCSDLTVSATLPWSPPVFSPGTWAVPQVPACTPHCCRLLPAFVPIYLTMLCAVGCPVYCCLPPCHLLPALFVATVWPRCLPALHCCSPHYGDLLFYLTYLCWTCRYLH